MCLIMCGILTCSYLIYELGVRCTKIKKLNSIIHGKNALLNNSKNERLGLNPCKILNTYYIFIKEKAIFILLSTEYSSIAIVTRN